CHISIQGNHLHLLVEADDKIALARGMQGFSISCAKQINATLWRKGRVFSDRYHAEPLTSPTQTRNALVYVLANWKKHQRYTPTVHDPYSSSINFHGWRDAPPVIRAAPFPIAFPHTWLLRTGWAHAP